MSFPGMRAPRRINVVGRTWSRERTPDRKPYPPLVDWAAVRSYVARTWGLPPRVAIMGLRP